MSERVSAVPGPGVERDEYPLRGEHVALAGLQPHARDALLRRSEQVAGRAYGHQHTCYTL